MTYGLEQTSENDGKCLCIHPTKELYQNANDELLLPSASAFKKVLVRKDDKIAKTYGERNHDQQRGDKNKLRAAAFRYSPACAWSPP